MKNIQLFDRKNIVTKSLSERQHDMDISMISQLNVCRNLGKRKIFNEVANRMIQARKKGGSIILMIGGHVIRAGVQKYIIDLMKRGYISCLAMNGGCMIHDFEFAMIGATTENVAYYIKIGQFGLWKETGILNDIINQAYRKNNMVGMGEAVGYAITQGDFPHKDISLLAAGHMFQVPLTIHVGIGSDIIHAHSNCDGAATGALSYNDFLKFISVVQHLENGVVMNFGSAVMAPEVFLKALSMVKNIARQKRRAIKHFTTFVCDLHHLPSDFTNEPPKDDPMYYFRPWKTMLVRTVVDGGDSFYVRGKHADTIPALWSTLNALEKRNCEIP